MGLDGGETSTGGSLERQQPMTTSCWHMTSRCLLSSQQHSKLHSNIYKDLVSRCRSCRETIYAMCTSTVQHYALRVCGKACSCTSLLSRVFSPQADESTPTHCAVGWLYCAVGYRTVLYCTATVSVLTYCTVLYCICTMQRTSHSARGGWRWFVLFSPSTKGSPKPPTNITVALLVQYYMYSILTSDCITTVQYICL